MALVLLRMLCSEANIERVFALLRRLFGDHAQHSRGDLVEARLTIMMNNLDVSREFILVSPRWSMWSWRRRPDANSPRSVPPLTARVSSS
jgi:hypothetical protein